jgi:hypothetical protein
MLKTIISFRKYKNKDPGEEWSYSVLKDPLKSHMVILQLILVSQLEQNLISSQNKENESTSHSFLF